MKKLITLVMLTLLVACGKGKEDSKETTDMAKETKVEKTEELKETKELNLYSERHYDVDKKVIENFEKETGVKVNVVKASGDELLQKMIVEGENTPADLYITKDAARLGRAKDKGLLQPVTDEEVLSVIPEEIKDPENFWVPFTYRARVLVYDKTKTKPEELSTYEDLADPKWKKQILVRSSTNAYNQALIASMIAANGEEETRKWIKGLVANMAREPKGNDRDQAKAMVAGEGKVAIMNSYYVGKLIHSADPEEVKVGEKLGIFFPNQDDRGTHINVSGMGITKNSKNKANAVKFMKYYLSDEIQGVFTNDNYEYPANKNVPLNGTVKEWGEFKVDSKTLSKLGEHFENGIKMADQEGWK